MLQNFTHPFGGHVSTVRARWNKEITVVDCIENVHELSNGKIPIEKRVVTFEGRGGNVREAVIMAGSKRQEIEVTCQAIARHITSFSNGAISVNSMELYFRVCEEKKLWLLFCTDFRMSEFNMKHRRQYSLPSLSLLKTLQPKSRNKKANIEREFHEVQLHLAIPENNLEPRDIVKNLRCTVDKGGLKEPVENIHCRLCLQIKPLDCQLKLKHLLYYIKYAKDQETLEVEDTKGPVLQFMKSLCKPGQRFKQVVEAFEVAESDLSRHQNNYGSKPNKMSKVLQWMFGHFSNEELEQKFKDDSFKELSISVCSDCFIKYTERAIESRLESKLLKAPRPSSIQNAAKIMGTEQSMAQLEHWNLTPLKKVFVDQGGRTAHLDSRSPFKRTDKHKDTFIQKYNEIQKTEVLRKEIQDVLDKQEMEAMARKRSSSPVNIDRHKYRLEKVFKIVRKRELNLPEKTNFGLNVQSFEQPKLSIEFASMRTQENTRYSANEENQLEKQRAFQSMNSSCVNFKLRLPGSLGPNYGYGSKSGKPKLKVFEFERTKSGDWNRTRSQSLSRTMSSMKTIVKDLQELRVKYKGSD